MNKISSVYPFIILALLATACAPLKQYRTMISGPSCNLSDSNGRNECASRSFYSIVGEPSQSARELVHGEAGEISRAKERFVHADLAIFEFDDLGHTFSEEQYQLTLGALRDLVDRSKSTLLVLFAHGWKNNAHAENQNLIDFENMLIDVAAIDQFACGGGSCSDRRVVGVYLGWRGLSATLQPFRELSFYNRKARAHLVGTQGAARLIADLRNVQADAETNDDNRLVLIGHSFGGAIIYSATHQQLTSALARVDENGTVDRNVADAILLINPAFEAAQYTTLFQAAAGQEFRGRHRPLLASFTSEADNATKRYFPLGRALSTVFTKHTSSRQMISNRRAIGHFDDYVSHHLLNTEKSTNPNDLASLVDTWERFQNGCIDEWAVGGFALRRTYRDSPAQIANPFMNVKVAEEMIEDHNQIWSREFARFLYAFIAVQESKRASNGCFLAHVCLGEHCSSDSFPWSCELLDRRDRLVEGKLDPASNEDRLILDNWCQGKFGTGIE